MEEYQKILFPYAYNILGSSDDAKDAIQDVLSNYVASPKEGIENEKNYLIRSVINQSINIRNKRKKVSYDYVWLPEPVDTEGADTNINLRDIVSYSLLILLEQLNPRERAVFILKEGFAYSHEEIAAVLSTTVENSRKLLSRAKARLHPPDRKTKIKAPAAEQVPSGILEDYVNAIRGKDMARLENMLSKDIVFYADGGGKMNLVTQHCTGTQAVAKLLVFVYHQFQTDYTFTFTAVNHQPALIYYYKGKIKGCQVLTLSEDQQSIYQISTIIDPDKLKHIGEDKVGN